MFKKSNLPLSGVSVGFIIRLLTTVFWKICWVIMVCVVFLGSWLLGVVLCFFLVLLECYVLLLFTVGWKLVVFLLFLVSGGFWVCRLLLLWGLTTGGGCRPTYGTTHTWDDTSFLSQVVISVVNWFCG